MNTQRGETSCLNALRVSLQHPRAGSLLIPLLKPIFQGALAPLGERLQCAQTHPGDAVRIEDLLQADALLALLQRQAGFRRSTDSDLRAVASAWTLEYLGVLLPPVVAAASVLQHVFPMAASQVWVQLDGRGSPLVFHIRNVGESRAGASTAQRYEGLLWLHLQPLFTALGDLTRVAPKILWGNAARSLEPILDQALALTGGASTIFRDMEQLLRSPDWPSDGHGPARANPLQGQQRVIHRVQDGRHIPLKLHRQCCLYHLLPDEPYCGACPLAPRHRQREDEIGATAT
jgi:ferric iron reductase protein FhuF